MATIAQSISKVTITGKTIEKTSNQPLSFATIVLLRSADDSLVTGVTTDVDGNFSIQVIPGSYRIEAKYIGYKTLITKNIIFDKNNKLSDFYLETDQSQLATVEVTAEKSSIEYGLDKKTFNVGKDLISKGGSANDILNNVPSVSVDIEGGISLRGNSNVMILINGKPSVLTANNGLEQIPSDTIEKIEVSTNPSSKYAAQGTAGIINIILKKNKTNGFGSSLQVTVGNPVNNSVNLNINYKTEKFNLFSNIRQGNYEYPGTMSYFQTNIGENGMPTSYISESVNSLRKRTITNMYVGGDYYINDQNTLTFSYYHRKNKSNNTVNYEYNYLDASKNPESIYLSTEMYEEPQNANQMEINYVKTYDKKGKKLTANVRYEFWNDDENENIEETQTFPIANQAINNVRSRDIESSKDIFFQSDYTLPVFEKSRLEMGVKGEIRRINSDYKVWLNEIIVDGFDNVLHYDENIYGVYFQYGNRENKFQYSLGLRVEHSDTKSTDRENVFFNHKKYTDLFPTVHLTYKFTDNNSLQLSYSKRITRPRFWQLNPFGGIADKNNIRYGNPDLNPMYTNSLELGNLMKIGKLTITPSVYYQHSTNIFEMITYKDSNDIIITKPINLGSEKRFGAELITSYSPYKWWRLSGEINYYSFDQKGNFNGVSYDSKNNSWSTRLNSTVKLYGFSMQTTFNHLAERVGGQTTRKALNWLDLGLSKDLLKDKMTMTVNVSNILNSRVVDRFVKGSNYTIESSRDSSQRRINLTLVYRFNRSKKDRDGVAG